MHLNYKHLHSFWAVAHDGNLTRTAARLNVSQSALSVQIRQLEDVLGHPLFVREGRQLHLTEAGRIALDHADAVFSVGEELLDTMHNRTGSARQVLRIGSQATLSRNFQVEFLAPLLQQADIALTLRSGRLEELLADLEAHRLDVVLSNTPPTGDGGQLWGTHLIAEQPVSLVGTRRRIGKRKTVAALLKAEPVLVPTQASSIRMAFDALTHRLGVQPRFAAEVDDMAMLRLLAREDAGLAVVPPIVVKDEIATGRLIDAANLPRLKETFYAITLQRHFPNPLVRTLVSQEARRAI